MHEYVSLLSAQGVNFMTGTCFASKSVASAISGILIEE